MSVVFVGVSVGGPLGSIAFDDHWLEDVYHITASAVMKAMFHPPFNGGGGVQGKEFLLGVGGPDAGVGTDDAGQGSSHRLARCPLFGQIGPAEVNAISRDCGDPGFPLRKGSKRAGKKGRAKVRERIHREASAGTVLLMSLYILGYRADAMVTGEGDQTIAESDSFVEERKQIAEDLVCPHGHVQYLVTVGSERVAYVVVG